MSVEGSAEGSGCRCIICHDYGDRDRLGNFDLRTIVHVKEYGWSVVLVPAEGDRPGWAYTVGLWHSHRSPELAMFGGDVYEMEVCLNTLGGQIAGGHPVADGEERTDVIEGQAVALRAVKPRWYEALFGRALAFYRRPPLPFVQVIWPDSSGRFPWHPGGDTAYLRAQPILWEPPDELGARDWRRDP